MKKIVTLIIMLIAITAIIWHRSVNADSVNSTTTTTQTPKSPDILCPDISDIKKNPREGNWIAETDQGTWKSFHLSFATNLTQFVGAQWVGANLGQVTCVYDSEQRFTSNGQPIVRPILPVLLIFQTLAFLPDTGKWENPKGKQGVRNCVSLQQSDCPFKENPKPKQGNIFQEAESLKPFPTDQTSPN